MTIEIVSLRTSKIENPWDVRIDRMSILGNPYLMNKPENTRDDVCDMYAMYHASMMGLAKGVSKKVDDFQYEMNRLKEVYLKHGKLRLFCFCAPRRCHAETIKQWILNET